MDKEKERKKGFGSILVSICFILFIGIYLFSSIILSDKEFSENENRELSKIPEVSSKSIAEGSFSKNFEKYVQDQLPGRERLIELKTMAEIVAGKRDNGLVYFGEDGYLFSCDRINTDQLEKNISYINSFNEENDIDISLMVIPSALNILKDKLPKYINTYSEDDAFGIIERESDVPIVDVRDTLYKHSDEYIYYKTDHHWTSLGAFYAYKEYCGKAKDVGEYIAVEVTDVFLGTNYSKAMLSSIEPDIIYRYEPAVNANEYTMDIYEGDEIIRTLPGMYDESYLDIKDKYGYFMSGNNPVTVIEKKDAEPEGKNILVVKDSFAHCFIPFIAEDHDRIVAADMRYYRKGLGDIIEKYEIDEVLFLYSINNISNDTNLVFINR